MAASTLRSALWHAFQRHTRGIKTLPVHPNHRPALSRVRDPKLIHSLPGTTGGGKGISHPSREKKDGHRTPPGPCVPHGGRLRDNCLLVLDSVTSTPGLLEASIPKDLFAEMPVIEISGCSTRRQCWAASAQRRCHPEEALYLPTFSHLFDCQ